MIKRVAQPTFKNEDGTWTEWRCVPNNDAFEANRAGLVRRRYQSAGSLEGALLKPAMLGQQRPGYFLKEVFGWKVSIPVTVLVSQLFAEDGYVYEFDSEWLNRTRQYVDEHNKRLKARNGGKRNKKKRKQNSGYFRKDSDNIENPDEEKSRQISNQILSDPFESFDGFDSFIKENHKTLICPF